MNSNFQGDHASAGWVCHGVTGVALGGTGWHDLDVTDRLVDRFGALTFRAMSVWFPTVYALRVDLVSCCYVPIIWFVLRLSLFVDKGFNWLCVWPPPFLSIPTPGSILFDCFFRLRSCI